MTAKCFLAASAFLGFLGVAAGAFGGHALKTRLSPEMQNIFEVGVRYHMYHALALLGTGLAALRFSQPLFIWAGGLILAGTVVFSGSLYILSLSGIRAWGAVTPLGGMLLLLGWLLLAVAFFKIS